MPAIILSADDFGRCHAVNQAVAEAHRHGVLTSASLMVTGAAAAEAAEWARRTPTLAVGLHLVLSDGRAAAPARRIAHLVDAAGQFPASPLRAGLRYAFGPAARRELACELRAQFERFAATGLPLSHVDGHQHLHVHPVVWHLLLPLAKEFGARAIRIPRDDLSTARPAGPRRALANLGDALVFGGLAQPCRTSLQPTGMICAHRTYGLMRSGHMDENYVIHLLRNLNAPLVEFYFHPTRGGRLDELGSNPGDLATLLSPAVRRVIEERGLRRVSYASLNP